MRIRRRVIAACAGVFFALLPVVAAAQEESGRALDPPTDWARVMLFAFAAMIATMLLATLFYLYRRRRNLVWDFQQPETPHDAGHGAAH